jgi:hypothetical protein
MPPGEGTGKAGFQDLRVQTERRSAPGRLLSRDSTSRWYFLNGFQHTVQPSDKSETRGGSRAVSAAENPGRRGRIVQSSAWRRWLPRPWRPRATENGPIHLSDRLSVFGRKVLSPEKNNQIPGSFMGFLCPGIERKTKRG